MTKPDVRSCLRREEPSKTGNNQTLTRGLEGLMVPHNEKAVRGDYDKCT